MDEETPNVRRLAPPWRVRLYYRRSPLTRDPGERKRISDAAGWSTPMHVTSIDWSLDVRHREKAFSGKVAIQFDGASDPFTVDSARLTIRTATLDGRSVQFREDATKGTLEFRGVSGASHRLEVEYDGQVDPNSLVGLYVSPAGSGYCLTTMLFPTGSRRLLPTFEDPTIKAVYRLVLTLDADLKAIFNSAPRSERTLPGGRREVTFEPTPRMSAYLLYLGVGPFDTLTIPGRRWLVTVAASPGRASAGRYCAERASEILAAYEQYYGVPYPLSKLDLVALENFWAGAMENWGAIAFRESAVLVDPGTTMAERRIILLVLAHEIAHQWFGNLVTPVGWDDFWLNESFASFVGHHIVGQLYPEENPWAYFLNRYTGRALFQDSRTATHPVKVPVSSPDELGEISDDVTYGKGASVLRMVESYLGEQVYRRGISQYLAKHQYANACAEDLWSALSEASARPVNRLMAEWITRPGYPVVTARWSDGNLHLRQSRFRADGAEEPAVWPIPLRIGYQGGEATVLFETPATDVPVPTVEKLLINPGRTAFVRVHYDDTLFDRLLKEFSGWSAMDQWGAVVDTHAFVYAGMTPLDRFLELVRVAASTHEEVTVRAVDDALVDLYLPLYGDARFEEVAREYLRGQLSAIGFERRSGEPESSALLREVLTLSLARVDPSYARELASRFPEMDQLAPELRPSVSLAFALTEGEAAFDPLVARLRSTVSDGERARLLAALGSLQESATLRRALDLVPSPGVTPAGALSLFGGLMTNPTGGRTFFEWYREKAGAISEMWAGTPLLSEVLYHLLPTVGLGQEEELTRYFEEHTPPEARISVALALETLKLRTRLRSKARAVR